MPNSNFIPSNSDDEDIIQLKVYIEEQHWNYRGLLTPALQNISPTSNRISTIVRMETTSLSTTGYLWMTTPSMMNPLIPYGYASQPETPQPFDIKDLVILTDGTCTSGMFSWVRDERKPLSIIYSVLNLCRSHDQTGQCQDHWNWMSPRVSK